MNEKLDRAIDWVLQRTLGALHWTLLVLTWPIYKLDQWFNRGRYWNQR